MSELKECLTQLNYCQRMTAEDKVRRQAEKKVKAFAIQYVKAKTQTERK